MTDAITINATTHLPTEYAGFGLLDMQSGQIHLFAHVIERLNLTLGKFGYEVSAVLESLSALQSLVELESAIKHNRDTASEDVFYDLL